MCFLIRDNRLNLHAGPLIQQEITADVNAPFASLMFTGK